jgi:pimeloyl-ACP methyl ester carboxylesterase
MATPRPKAILSFYPLLQFTAEWTRPLAWFQKAPDYPPSHIIFAMSQTLSDPNPKLKRFPDGSLDWGMDVRSPRVGWFIQNAKDGTLWTSIMPGNIRQMADPYENRTTVPTLIVQGTNGHILPIEHTRQMVRKLEGWGVECGLIEAEGEGVGFDFLIEESDSQWQYILPGLQFLARHVFQ